MLHCIVAGITARKRGCTRPAGGSPCRSNCLAHISNNVSLPPPPPYCRPTDTGAPVLHTPQNLNTDALSLWELASRPGHSPSHRGQTPSLPPCPWSAFSVAWLLPLCRVHEQGFSSTSPASLRAYQGGRSCSTLPVEVTNSACVYPSLLSPYSRVRVGGSHRAHLPGTGASWSCACVKAASPSPPPPRPGRPKVLVLGPAHLRPASVNAHFTWPRRLRGQGRIGRPETDNHGHRGLCQGAVRSVHSSSPKL